MRALLSAVVLLALVVVGCAAPKTPGTPSRQLAKIGEPCGGIAGMVCEDGLRCVPLTWSRNQDPRAPGMVDELGRCVPADAP